MARPSQADGNSDARPAAAGTTHRADPRTEVVTAETHTRRTPPRAAAAEPAGGPRCPEESVHDNPVRNPVNLPRTPMESASGWRPVDPPRRPVLFVNPTSGGGKAARAGLAERARERGVEAVVLDPGQDLAALARDAAAGGADVLGVAGGDGSLAVVAAVAAAHGIAFACVPAGTRNHFALDVGVDRHDLTGALDAFTDGVERQIDVAEVNGRMFLNNVSLGIYGQAVRRRLTAMPRCARSWRPRRRCWARAGRRPRCAWPTTRGANTAVPPWCSCRTIPMPWTTRWPPAPARRSTPAGRDRGPRRTRRHLPPPRTGLDRVAPGGECPGGGTRRGRRRGGGPQPAAAVRHPAGRAAGPDLLAPSGRVAIGAPPPPRPPAPAGRQPGLTTPIKPVLYYQY